MSSHSSFSHLLTYWYLYSSPPRSSGAPRAYLAHQLLRLPHPELNPEAPVSPPHLEHAALYEGYFLKLPQVVYLSAAEMASEASAADFLRVNIEVLQMQLDGTNENEEGRVEFIREGEMTLAGLDEAYEKRYDLLVGDLPPSRFLVLFGRTGRYMVTATFLQSDLGEVTARNLLGSLAARLRNLEAGE